MINDLPLRGLFIDWDKIEEGSYLRRIPALAGVGEITFRNPVTFFVGENGSGKSTLLEAIAVAAGFNPEGGTRNYSFSTYDSHSELCGALRLSRGVWRASHGYFLRAESFYNVATKEEEYSRDRAESPSIFMRDPTGRVFSPWRRTASGAAGCIFWMSRRRLFHLSVS